MSSGGEPYLIQKHPKGDFDVLHKKPFYDSHRFDDSGAEEISEERFESYISSMQSLGSGASSDEFKTRLCYPCFSPNFYSRGKGISGHGIIDMRPWVNTTPRENPPLTDYERRFHGYTTHEGGFICRVDNLTETPPNSFGRDNLMEMMNVFGEVEIAHRQLIAEKEKWGQEVPPIDLPPYRLCNVCFDWSQVQGIKRDTLWKTNQARNYQGLSKSVLATPPEAIEHIASSWKPLNSMAQSDTQPYSTNRLRQGEKTLLFIHKPTVHEGHLWVHVGIEGEERPNYKDEVTESNFRKYTMNGSKGRVLCAMCFSEKDMLQLEAKYGQRAREAWKKTVDPREWAD